MTSTPMTLEDALRFSGYTIDAYESDANTINTTNGVIAVPAMILSKLVWHRTHPQTLGSAFYLDKLPTFHPDYAPVQLSLILDRFRSRRLAYDTPDEFALAVRRWGALHLGAMSTLTRRYLSTATDLSLDTVNLTIHSESTSASTDDGSSESTTTGTGVDNTTTTDTGLDNTATTDIGTDTTTTAGTGTDTTTTTGTGSDIATSTDTTDTTSKGRDAQSDFPQGTLAGNADYASGAVDSVTAGNVVGSGTTTAESEQSGTSTTESDQSGTSTTESDRTGTSKTEREQTGTAITERELAGSESSEDHRNTTGESVETRTERGRSGRSVMELLEEQRNLFLNVDEELLNTMEPLFLGVFDRSTADNPTPYPYSHGRGWGW